MRTFEDVVNDLKDSGATVFAIGIGTNATAGRCSRWPISRAAAPSSQDVEQLPDQFRGVVDDLRRRYVVGYTSSNAKHDGSWRKVDIAVKSEPQATVRSTGGYTAPDR